MRRIELEMSKRDDEDEARFTKQVRCKNSVSHWRVVFSAVDRVCTASHCYQRITCAAIVDQLRAMIDNLLSVRLQFVLLMLANLIAAV